VPNTAQLKISWMPSIQLELKWLDFSWTNVTRGWRHSSPPIRVCPVPLHPLSIGSGHSTFDRNECADNASARERGVKHNPFEPPQFCQTFKNPKMNQGCPESAARYSQCNSGRPGYNVSSIFVCYFETMSISAISANSQAVCHNMVQLAELRLPVAFPSR
jgi:hypothetical protein